VTHVSYGKTAQEIIIGKYEFSKSLTIKMPEYRYLGVDENNEELKYIVDSELEITEDSLFLELYGEDLLKGKYTLKYENKERGEIELVLITGDGPVTIINIEIIDDHYIVLRQEKGSPPFAFKKVLEFNNSPEKSKREKEYFIEGGNNKAEYTLHCANSAIASHFSYPQNNTFDLEALKKEGLYIDEDVSIEILINKIDSFIVVCMHKKGDTKFILGPDGFDAREN